LIIRKIERRDIPCCAEILMSVYNNELWQCRWEKETACAYLTDFFEAKKFVGYLICEAESVLGAVFAHEKIWWNNSEIFVEEMFVVPERQRSGLGTALLNEIEKYVREKKLAGITLSTNKYAPAPRFYEKNGFSACEHVLFMAKETE